MEADRVSRPDLVVEPSSDADDDVSERSVHMGDDIPFLADAGVAAAPVEGRPRGIAADETELREGDGGGKGSKTLIDGVDREPA